MDVTRRVAELMKPKVKRLGFTKKVLKSVAAEIAGKLDIADDASEEDVDAKINEAIDAAMPYISLIQSQANSQLEEWKRNQQKNDDDEDDDEDGDSSIDDENSSSPVSVNRSNKPNRQQKNNPKQSKELKILMEAVQSLTKEISSLKEGKTAETRRSKLEAILKDSGAWGKSKLRDFSRATFKDEEDFEEYLSDVKEDLKTYNQERADNGLSTLGNPPGGKGGKQETTEEVFSDEQIDIIMKNL